MLIFTKNQPNPKLNPTTTNSCSMEQSRALLRVNPITVTLTMGPIFEKS